nr:hypothetical protein [uncultured Brevundimonas sp.]
MTETLPDLKPIGDDPGIKRLNDAWASIQQQIHNSRAAFADAFEYGIDSALRGDWKGVLSAIIGDSFRNGLSGIVKVGAGNAALLRCWIC